MISRKLKSLSPASASAKRIIWSYIEAFDAGREKKFPTELWRYHDLFEKWISFQTKEKVIADASEAVFTFSSSHHLAVYYKCPLRLGKMMSRVMLTWSPTLHFPFPSQWKISCMLDQAEKFLFGFPFLQDPSTLPQKSFSRFTADQSDRVFLLHIPKQAIKTKQMQTWKK